MKLKHTLFTLYIFIWLLLSIDPWYREDWLLENLLVFMALPILIWGDRRFGFSNTSVWMLFIFFVLHGIGAHYTYSEMPWFSSITQLFGFERNHYDRLIHFSFGFLLFLPFYELFITFHKSTKMALIFTFIFLLAASGVYEVIEWIATEITHAKLGTAFLGIQGDPWDSQKDMFLSYLGSILAFIFWSQQLLKLKHKP
ncbi:MAG: DUF2238 domain-containing protein [Campylobacterales bacterium]|nr:DUF2238 domain-containing protein [Campylobacterales bacterium]